MNRRAFFAALAGAVVGTILPPPAAPDDYVHVRGPTKLCIDGVIYVNGVPRRRAEVRPLAPQARYVRETLAEIERPFR